MFSIKSLILMLVVAIAVIGCVSDDDGNPEITVLTTASIKTAPFYFSFDAGTSVSNIPDVILKYEDRSYILALNATANVSVAVVDSGDFESATYDMTAHMPVFDSDTVYAIGDHWMDMLTYNGMDHSISSNDEYYFIRCVDYSIVKLKVGYASPSAFALMTALSMDGSTFPTAVADTFAYADGVPTALNLIDGTVIDSPADWQIAFITAPVSGSPYPMQSMIINFDNGTQVGIVSSQDFDAIDAVPATIDWLTDTGTARPLAYSGAHEIFHYNETTHVVSILDNSLVYIVNHGTEYAKLQIINYDQPSGIVEFQYMAL